MEITATRTDSRLEMESEDNKLFRRAEQALAESGRKPLLNVEVSVQDGVLTLKGWVSTYHLKQMAQSIVMKTEGVEIVQNDIMII